MQIIDVTIPTAPSVVSNVLIPATTTGGNLAAGNSIFYNNGYIYLGLNKSGGSGSEFNIIDVGGGNGSPTNPIPLGTYQVGRTINSIYVKDNYAYLATDDNVSGNKQLLVLNITDKSLTPLPVASYFTVSGAGYGNSLDVKDHVYLGRSSAISSPTLYVLDNTYPLASKLTSLGSITTSSSTKSIISRGDLIFLLTNREFQVWNASDPRNIYPWTPNKSQNEFIPLSVLGVDGSGQASNCVGNYIYVGASFKDVGGNNKDVIAIIGPSPLFDYTITNSGDITVNRQSSQFNTISLGLVSGQTKQITFQITGLPSHTNYSFSQGSCNPSCTTKLMLSPKNSENPGTYPITVSGSPDGVSPRSTTFNLIVK